VSVPATVLAFSTVNQIAIPSAAGIVEGSVYGLLALGIVLIYKSNRIFNFAQAEFGGVAAFIALAFVNGMGPFPEIPYFWAMVLGVIAGCFTALITERLVIRPLFHSPRATLLVATVGVALFLGSMEAVFLGGVPYVFPKPGGQQSRFSIFGSLHSINGYKFGWAEIDAVIFLAVLAVGAVIFFRSKYGVAILAVSQDPTAASVVGISVERISMLTWGIAGLLGGVAGIVQAPITGGVFPGFASGFAGDSVPPLVFALIAAVLGGMTSLPGAFLGGLLLGVIDNIAANDLPSSIPGGGDITLLAVLLVVLLVRPAGILGRET
jgi:branched-chain amino acid transport system permease protein